ncbi:MAG: DUF1016 N-terminal domain-containing protein [Myxococcales bacterium]|jgi:endonuclease YncB( thermonuclease family)
MGRDLTSTRTLTPAGYRKLLGEVRALLDAGRAEAQSAVGHILVTTYWKVGRRILREKLSEHAGYGSGILQELATELEMDVGTLQRAVAFARLYEGPPGPGLSWVHYRELLTLKDAAARNWYGRRALSEGWTGRKLAREIRSGAFAQEQAEGGAAGQPRLQRPREATHVYKARVQRVVDGDTLLLHVDLGFSVIKEQRLRLAALDAPPRNTPGGRAATRAVLDRLGACEFVVVKTNKVDLHGRYVGHVFYAPRTTMDAAEVFEKGRYLNDELLREGLVVPM